MFSIDFPIVEISREKLVYFIFNFDIYTENLENDTKVRKFLIMCPCIKILNTKTTHVTVLIFRNLNIDTT